MSFNLIAVRDAFVRTFESSPFGKETLEELKRFCRYTRPTYVPGDTHESAYLEGRRSVIIEIERVLKLTDEDIEKLTRTESPGGME